MYEPATDPKKLIREIKGKSNGQREEQKNGADDSGKRPSIDAGDHNLERVSALGWNALVHANRPPRLFRFGETPVRVDPREDGVLPVPKILTEHLLSYELARSAHWYCTGKKGDIEDAAPTMRMIRDMLAAPSYPLPSLLGIVQTPVFAPNGALHMSPGYHADGRTFYAPDSGFQVPAVPDVPTTEDVNHAKSLILDDLMGDFPFVSESERTNAVALFLDPYVRNLIDGPTPMRMIEAPTPGSGKGLLAEVMLRTAIGARFELTPAPSDNDEWRKTITTKLVQAPTAIVIDNLTTAMDSGALAAALTTTWWSSRRLGTNDDISVPARALWVVTANNPTVSTEIARRTVRIRLDPKVDRPWKRTGFRHDDLRAWAREHRSDLVWAALTLVRSWVVAGQPRGTQRLGSYEDWAAIQGGILANAGIAGFLDNVDLFYEAADIEGATWRQFVDAWFEKFGEAEVGVADLFDIAMNVEGFDFGKGSERSQRTVFGRQCGQHRDRVIGDCRIVQTRTVQRAKKWRLIKARPGGNPFDVFHVNDQHESKTVPEAGDDQWTM